MGHTTNKGFWIPEKPLAPPAEALLALPELARSRPLKPHSRAAAVPKPRKRLSSRPPKEIKMETEEELDEEPPQVKTLLIEHVTLCLLTPLLSSCGFIYDPSLVHLFKHHHCSML